VHAVFLSPELDCMSIGQDNFSLKAIGYYQKQMLVALKSDYKSLWVDYFLNLILCYT